VPEVLTYIREERGASATGGRGSHIHKETVTTLLSDTIVRYIKEDKRQMEERGFTSKKRTLNLGKPARLRTTNTE
jgi:hypothetical protein